MQQNIGKSWSTNGFSFQLGRRFILQQDNDPKAYSEWPSESPDLNPIGKFVAGLGKRLFVPDPCATWQNLSSLAKNNGVKLQCPDVQAWLKPNHTDTVLWLWPKLHLLNTWMGWILMQSLILLNSKLLSKKPSYIDSIYKSNSRGKYQRMCRIFLGSVLDMPQRFWNKCSFSWGPACMEKYGLWHIVR